MTALVLPPWAVSTSAAALLARPALVDAAVHPATGLVLGLAWAAAVAVVADGALGRRERRLPSSAGDGTGRGGDGARHDDAGLGPLDRRTTRPGVLVLRAVTWLGAAIRRSLAPVAARSHPGTPLEGGAALHGGSGPARDPALHVPPAPDDPTPCRDGAADRRTGWAALASGFLLLVAPALAAAPVTWAVAAPVLAARRGHARHEAALADQLPDVVDLLALTAGAGLPVAAALVAIGRRPGGPLGAGLGRAAAHVRHGGSTAEALGRLAATGPAVRPLVDALVQHERYGTPLVPALERVGIEARARRRRRNEEAARRLPVTLLFPLVLTTFPAFVLLTVVPLLAGSLGSLSLSPT